MGWWVYRPTYPGDLLVRIFVFAYAGLPPEENYLSQDLFDDLDASLQSEVLIDEPAIFICDLVHLTMPLFLRDSVRWPLMTVIPPFSIALHEFSQTP